MIKENLQRICATIPDGVTLVAVSKFHPMEAICEAYSVGQRVFGESRVQELAAKVGQVGVLDSASVADCCGMPGLKWHFIGHLQTNKVRQLLRLRPALIESVDSERLLCEIDREAARQGIVQRVLMQVHVAQEETKFGFAPDELEHYFRDRRFEQLQATHICGVMGMASNTDDTVRITADFRKIRHIFDNVRMLCPDLRGFDCVSMGMSDDYQIAIACGSTMVRIGTDIFGRREY